MNSEPSPRDKLRAIEFYSGIGGLHLALARSSVSGTVVRAFDWDQAACQVYEANHGKSVVSKCDIGMLTARDIAAEHADIWLLSPSCQPYTVLNPLAKGAEDPRAKSFIHLMENVLPDLVAEQQHPKYMLVENVAGFETSSTRQRILHILHVLQYTVLELLLTPLQFGIPNSRLRYYLLAKAKPLAFDVTDNMKYHVWKHIPGKGLDWEDPRSAGNDENLATVKELRRFLDLGESKDFRIPDKVLEKWGRLFDIVTPSSKRSCCFTRGYTKMAERSGSVLQSNEELDTTEVFDNFLARQRAGDQDAVRVLDRLQLRYFSPSELLRIFCFVPPPSEGDFDFAWPQGISTKTKYRLIGNSVNVAVVSCLVDYLLE